MVRWEDLEDREDRCPACLHWWSSHGAEPDPDGCGMPTSTMDERERGIFEICGGLERPAPSSEMAVGLAREAERMRAYDRRTDRMRSTGRAEGAPELRGPCAAPVKLCGTSPSPGRSALPKPSAARQPIGTCGLRRPMARSSRRPSTQPMLLPVPL